MFRRTLPALFWFGVGLGLAPVCAGQTAELGLILQFDARPSVTFVKSMKAELISILRPTGLKVDWLDGSAGEPGSLWRRVLFQFHGTCTGSAENAAEILSALTLADAHAAGNSVLPFIETNCSRLRQFLALSEPRLTGEETRMGRAMGRLLAHELYHFLLQTRGHGKNGIARAVQTPAALLGRSLEFQKEELDRIRSSYTSKTPNAKPTGGSAGRTAQQ